jgi:hypothetical protein
MTSKERARIAMSGGVPDCVPVIPQICPPHAVRVARLPFKETIVDILRNPRKHDLLISECAANYGVDGFRVWMASPPVKVEWEGEYAYEVDPETGERTGTVDFSGGGHAVRLKSKQRQLTDEDIDKIEIVDADALLASEGLVPTKKVIERFGKSMFVAGCPGAFTVEIMYHTQGMEASLTDIVDRPEFIKRLTDRLTEAAIQKGIAMAKAGVDAIYIGETFGQFMSPEQFGELCVPYFRRFVGAVRPYGPLMYLHMCGRVTHLVDQVLETGVDCLEPLDIVAGTDAKAVRERVGNRISLMGGVNTVLLSRGTVEQVRRDCERCIRDAGKAGGYLLAACDMLPTETAPEKVRAMLECARTTGRYGG